MKKLYANLLAALALVVCSAYSSTAYAVDAPSVIEDGQTITLSRQTQDANWQFTAPFTGLLRVQSTSFTYFAGHASGGTFLYSTFDDATGFCSGPVNPAVVPQVKPEGYLYTFKVTENTTYYVHFGVTVSTAVDNVNFTFNMEDGVVVPEISAIYPEPTVKTAYPFAMYPQAQIIFNVFGSVKWEGTKSLSYIDNDDNVQTMYIEAKAVADEMGYNRFDVDIYKAIMEAKKNGLKSNSEFVVNLGKPILNDVPVTGDYIDEDGNLVLKYLYGNLTSCTSYTVPSPILSYWPENADNATMVFTFDGDLMPLSNPKQTAQFIMYAGEFNPEPSGDDESGMPVLPGAPMVIDGNTLTINLAGVRRPASSEDKAYALLQSQPYTTLIVEHLLDINGNVIDFNSSSIIAFYNQPFTLLEKVDLMYEFTPAAGSLADVDKIELWITNDAFDHIRIDGFTFTAGETTVNVTDFTTEADPVDSTSSLIYIPVPAEMQTIGGEVEVSADIFSLDSYDYTLSTTYNNGEGSGVEAVATDGSYTVYGIDGVRVFKGSNLDTNALPKGFYIINGKKVVVK